MQKTIWMTAVMVLVASTPAWAQRNRQPKTPMSSAAAKLYEKREFEGKDGRKLTYYVMKPKDYDSSKKYPLVLCLHGRGGRTVAANVLAKSDMREKHPCFVLAPTSPRPNWWSVPPSRSGERTGKPTLPLVLAAAKDLEEEFSIDPDRIYVTGQSMGGFGSFGAIVAEPDRFAAAVPIAGGWDPKAAEKIKDVSLWVFHGEKDPTVKVELSRNMVEAIRKAGGEPKYTEYEGVKHNSWTRTYANKKMWEWMFAQRRSPKEDE